MRKAFIALLAPFLFLGACTTSSDGAPGFDKAGLAGAGGKADTDVQSKICLAIGEDQWCDLCGLAGWYGDGECDTFCQQHDTDCGVVCGGWLGQTCEPDEFCAYPLDATCGWADASGICTPMPEACTYDVNPVCGCDGSSYSNTCAANAAGTAVLHLGECEDAGVDGDGGVAEACGDNVCASGELCCAGCPGQEPFGCVDASMGCPLIKCVPPREGSACGGLLGAGCAGDEFCNYAPEAICGAADQTGTCDKIPEACTLVYDPVCGCDGNTYGSPCTAHASGMSFVSYGECTP
jgi:hypothetical protein